MTTTRPPSAPLVACFGAENAARLVAACHLDLTALVLAYCLFENRFGAAGGLLPVARALLPRFRGRVDRAVVLSPLHEKLNTAPRPADLEPVGTLGPVVVPFGSARPEVQLYRYVEGGVDWILIRSAAFFTADGGEGGTNPYEYTSRDGWDDPLLRDALFFGAAVPHVLAALGLTRNVVVHGQDWQCGGLALTVPEAILAGVLDSAAVVLTLHNMFDRYLPESMLAAVTERVADRHWPPSPSGGHRATVLSRMIPLLRGPVSAVSESFRRELTTDPIFTEYFGPHLQAVLRVQGVITTTDAAFGCPIPPFSKAAVVEVKGGLS